MKTAAKEKEMDMLNGGIAGKLILFSLPLAFSSILQQFFNSADVAVVGRFAGDQALAVCFFYTISFSKRNFTNNN